MVKIFGGFILAINKDNLISVTAYIITEESIDEAMAVMANENLKTHPLKDGWHSHNHNLSEATQDQINDVVNSVLVNSQKSQ